MAKTVQKKPVKNALDILRGIAIGTLGIVGLISLVSFTTSHWVEKQILTPRGCGNSPNLLSLCRR